MNVSNLIVALGEHYRHLLLMVNWLYGRANVGEIYRLHTYDRVCEVNRGQVKFPTDSNSGGHRPQQPYPSRCLYLCCTYMCLVVNVWIR